MARQAKSLENIEKHLTQEEIAAREQAERETMPLRALDPQRPPKSLAKDTAAKRYWQEILRKMEGYAILDALDADTLALFCSMLSRRCTMNDLCVRLMNDSAAKGIRDDVDARLELMDRADALSAKLQMHEKTLLSYAKELGLTPSGRVALARKKASAAAEERPTDDMFGD